MDNNKTFTLIGEFKDKISGPLKKISKSFDTLNKNLEKFQSGKAGRDAATKSFEKLSKTLQVLEKDFERLGGKIRPVSKELGRMAYASQTLNQSLRDQRSALDTSARGLSNYRKEMGKVAASQRQLQKKMRLPQSVGGEGGGGGMPRASRYRDVERSMGDGFTIEKGIVSNLAANAITAMADALGGAVSRSIGYIQGAIQERVQDEMSDIQSAGGIFSVGKDKKISWADTYEEGFELQRALNKEMALLAAALPGETNDYVRNMKMVTDTVMKVTAANGPEMIKAMQGFNSSVKDNKSAFVEATKLLAKYTTLSEQGSAGGTPITALAEQMINADQVSIKSLKMKYSQLKNNPLLSGALEDLQGEMNKFGANTAGRFKAMIKAFDKAFPPEVIAAMTKSADGIYQAMKSALLDPDTGLLGLGRQMEIDFSGIKGRMGEAKQTLSVFDMLVKMFGTFGMIVTPILEILPKIFDPLRNLVDPLRELYVNTENTMSNLNAARKYFKGFKDGSFRAALKALGQLAQAFGGNKAEIDKLNRMLMDARTNPADALRQTIKTLFGSDALKRVGEAFGKALGGFFTMLAGMGGEGSKLIDESGLLSGFMSGWKESGGTKAIMKIAKDAITFFVKTFISVLTEVITSQPLIDTAIMAFIFIGPVRELMIGFLTRAVGVIGASLASANIGGLIAGNLGGIMAALTAAVGPALIAGLVILVPAIIYAFQKPILAGLDRLSSMISGSTMWGPIREMLLGLVNSVRGVVNAISGLVNSLIGLVTGDKARVIAGWRQFVLGLTQIWDGLKSYLGGIKNAVMQGADALKKALIDLMTGVADTVRNIVPGLPGKTGTPAGKTKAKAKAFGGQGVSFGTLGEAVAYEMKNKPPGSDLVIANSSETIIPAAGGLNGDGIVSAIYTTSSRLSSIFVGSLAQSSMRMASAFTTALANSSQRMASAFTTAIASSTQRTATAISTAMSSLGTRIQTGQSQLLTAINRGIAQSSAENRAIMGSLRALAASGGFMGGGGPLGGAPGSLAMAASMAASMGLTMTSFTGGRHAAGSYHYQGRAMDFSDSAGPSPGMMRFAQAMASRFGSSITELIYSPLGYSIKNGKKVPPYAVGQHYNHVHVAFAHGEGNGRYFPSAADAISYERAMAPSGAKVSTITANSSEGFGSTIHAPITINGYNRDPEELASLVAMKISEAVNTRRRSSGVA